MNKIGLDSIPWQNVDRNAFLLALAEAILKLPLKEETVRVLSLKFPREDINGNQTASLLSHMLDKGVILVKNTEPSDWSNSFDVWMSDINIFVTPYGITEEGVKIAFEDVNQYLEGFGFVLGVVAHAWLFSYMSVPFEISIAEQMAKLFAMR